MSSALLRFTGPVSADPPDLFNRMIILMQTGVDASDPTVWGSHVLQNRMDDNGYPDLLFPVCSTDEVVPPATAKALSHGLNIPQMAPVLDKVPLLEIQEAPLHANAIHGTTSAYFQMDRITVNGTVQPSGHNSLSGSDEGILNSHHFILTYLEGSTEIINPYEVLNTPPLDELR